MWPSRDPQFDMPGLAYVTVKECTANPKENEELEGNGATIQTSRVPPEVFQLWDFPTSSTVQHPSCTGAEGYLVLPVLI